MFRLKSLILSMSFLLFAISHAEDYSGLFEKSKSAVGTIETFDKNNDPISQGTGFFVSGDGQLITNRHVLEGAVSAHITLENKSSFSISMILEEDSDRDILKAQAEISKTTNFLNLELLEPKIGEEALVIGTPVGLDFTFSSGNVSNIRDDSQYTRVIQFTSPISHGSSGSPVLNKFGRVIGIATYARIDGAGLNFAMPSYFLTKMKKIEMPLVMWGRLNPLKKEMVQGTRGPEPKPESVPGPKSEPGPVPETEPKNRNSGIYETDFSYNYFYGDIPIDVVKELKSEFVNDSKLLNFEDFDLGNCGLVFNEVEFENCEYDLDSNKVSAAKTFAIPGKCVSTINNKLAFSFENDESISGFYTLEIDVKQCSGVVVAKNQGAVSFIFRGYRVGSSSEKLNGSDSSYYTEPSRDRKTIKCQIGYGYKRASKLSWNCVQGYFEVASPTCPEGYHLEYKSDLKLIYCTGND